MENGWENSEVNVQVNSMERNVTRVWVTLEFVPLNSDDMTPTDALGKTLGTGEGESAGFRVV